MSNSEDTKVAKSAFIAAMQKKRQALATAAKTERKVGYMEDIDILNKLGLEPNEKRTYPATVSKIVGSFAKQDPDRPAFRFHYVLGGEDPNARGTQLSNYYILEETDYNTLEEVAKRITDEFQGIGIDTRSWTPDNLIEQIYDAMETVTKNKPAVNVGVVHYITKKSESKLILNVYPERKTAPANNSDLVAFTNKQTAPAPQPVPAPQRTRNAPAATLSVDPTVYVGKVVEFDWQYENGPARVTLSIHGFGPSGYHGIDSFNEPWDESFPLPFNHPFQVVDKTPF